VLYFSDAKLSIFSAFKLMKYQKLLLLRRQNWDITMMILSHLVLYLLTQNLCASNVVSCWQTMLWSQATSSSKI